jgi:hypothetical protein
MLLYHCNKGLSCLRLSSKIKYQFNIMSNSSSSFFQMKKFEDYFRTLQGNNSSSENNSSTWAYFIREKILERGTLVAFYLWKMFNRHPFFISELFAVTNWNIIQEKHWNIINIILYLFFVQSRYNSSIITKALSHRFVFHT